MIQDNSMTRGLRLNRHQHVRLRLASLSEYYPSHGIKIKYVNLVSLYICFNPLSTNGS